eukprot:6212740-Pleurochrysis_carterae.AAC.4
MRANFQLIKHKLKIPAPPRDRARSRLSRPRRSRVEIAPRRTEIAVLRAEIASGRTAAPSCLLGLLPLPPRRARPQTPPPPPRTPPSPSPLPPPPPQLWPERNDLARRARPVPTSPPLPRSPKLPPPPRQKQAGSKAPHALAQPQSLRRASSFQACELSAWSPTVQGSASWLELWTPKSPAKKRIERVSAKHIRSEASGQVSTSARIVAMRLSCNCPSVKLRRHLNRLRRARKCRTNGSHNKTSQKHREERAGYRNVLSSSNVTVRVQLRESAAHIHESERTSASAAADLSAVSFAALTPSISARMHADCSEAQRKTTASTASAATVFATERQAKFVICASARSSASRARDSANAILASRLSIWSSASSNDYAQAQVNRQSLRKCKSKGCNSNGGGGVQWQSPALMLSNSHGHRAC